MKDIKSVLNKIGFSQEQWPRLTAFFGWLKQPSNLLSVAAIVAVVIVPLIEKVLKADEELRAKIDTLLETTNKIVAMNQERMSLPVSPVLGTDAYAMLNARRENELARASAIARSIKHDVYPVVLFALSNELCASGNFEEAQIYLSEVLNRGTGIRFLMPRSSVDERSQAHVVSANCYAMKYQRNGGARIEDKKLADYEMATAVSTLEHEDANRTTAPIALIYSTWAKLDERFGNAAEGGMHREKAKEIIKKMPFVDPAVIAIIEGQQPTPQPLSPALKPDTVPRSPDASTYIVGFPGNSHEEGALVLHRPDAKGKYMAQGSLYLYHRGLFTETAEINNLTTITNKPELLSIEFHRTVPTPSMSGKTPQIDVVWTIERMDKNEIAGVQSRLGQRPRPFVARLSANPKPTP
jgi:hypothetical protein